MLLERRRIPKVERGQYHETGDSFYGATLKPTRLAGKAPCIESYRADGRRTARMMSPRPQYRI